MSSRKSITSPAHVIDALSRERRRMSLLREAQSCIRNQHLHKAANAFINVAKSAEVEDAVRSADARRTTNKPKSPIDGRLLAVKDNICSTSLPTTCASGILKNYTSPFDATVVERLHQSGALLAGKTNLDEFGMGSHSIYSHFGPVTSRSEYSAGGSSGGSAVAVATGQCYAAIGTDTGGSVRLPAAYSGIVGFKPSYGRISRWGVIPYANSLDVVGIMAPTCRIARSTYVVLDAYDHRDPTSLTNSFRNRISERVSERGTVTSLRIGVPAEYITKELDPKIRSAWTRILAKLQSQGHKIQLISLASTPSALSAYYVLAPAEASSNLAKFDGIRYGTRVGEFDSAEGEYFTDTRGSGFGDEVRRRIILGAYSLSAKAMDNYFIRAQKVRRMVQQDFDRVFRFPNLLVAEENESVKDGVDVLLCPTAPSLAPKLSEIRASSPFDAYMGDVLTVPASLAGLPAMSVPVSIDSRDMEKHGEDPGVGLQIIGQFGDEDSVFHAAKMVEDCSAEY